LIFRFLEISQKPPGGQWTTARRHMYFCLVSGFLRGTAWRWALCRQATHTIQPRFWVSLWMPGGGDWPARRREPRLFDSHVLGFLDKFWSVERVLRSL